MKIDIVMWAKNGQQTLPEVLNGIDRGIPHEEINQKIFVDDRSSDRSVAIAEDYGWKVFTNKKGGVGAGANLALNKVRTKYFMSVEQDVVLTAKWWDKIPHYLQKKDVVIAQGWRISDHPIIGKLDEYGMQRFQGSLCSIDNTIYKTQVIKNLGGFPEHLKYMGVDGHLHRRVKKAGFKWITDSRVLSIHLRKRGLREHIERHYKYGVFGLKSGMTHKEGIMKNLKIPIIAFFSLMRALEIALKMKCPQIVYYYPIMRFAFLKGYLKSGTNIEQVIDPLD